MVGEINGKTFKIYLNKTLFDELMSIEVPKGGLIKPFNLMYVLYTIRKLTFRKKGLTTKDNYISLNARKLQQSITDYRAHLDFLEANNLIESLGAGYTVGKESRNYRIPSHLLKSAEVVSVVIDGTLGRKLKRYDTKRLVIAQDRNPELTKWFYGDLMKFEIDYDKAESYIEAKYSDDEVKRDKRLNDISNLRDSLYKCSREGNDDRFHSNFTSLAGDLKQFITYDGQSIIEFDIKSCQPMLITVVIEHIVNVALKHRYLLSSKQEHIFRRLIKKDLRVVFYKLYNNDSYKYSNDKSILINKNSKVDIDNILTSITTMLQESMVSIDFIEIDRFKTQVRSGDIYVSFGEQLLNKGLVEEYVDDETGELFYTVKLFDKKKESMQATEPDTLRNTGKAVIMNAIYMPSHYKSCKALNYFRDCYSSIELMMNALRCNTKNWKDRSDKNFSRFIQHIEARTMLDYVVKKVSVKHPNMLQLTIHDCIATTAEYAILLEVEFKELLKQRFGFPVTIGGKSWTKEVEVVNFSERVEQVFRYNEKNVANNFDINEFAKKVFNIAS